MVTLYVRFLANETMNIVVDPDDDGDDEGDSAAEDERAEMEQRTINNQALGPESLEKICFSSGWKIGFR